MDQPLGSLTMVSGHSWPWGQRPRHLYLSDSPSLGSMGKDTAMTTVYDALVYYCGHKCIGDCPKPPCCAYQLGDVKPHYPVPALRDQMNLAHPVVLWFHEYIDEHGVAPD